MNKCFFGIHNWNKWSYPIDAQNNDFLKYKLNVAKIVVEYKSRE